jgi:redox-sensitive bicupin YhaK (pirin superfamily)
VTQIIKSKDRYFADHGWLQTHWHFSFSDYHDPNNVNWGALRVFNDDVVQPGGGFDMHPHRDMEIITYVLSGELEHQDHLGNRGVVKPGEVQVMSAGRGIVHAERNPSPSTPVHLLQIWIMPKARGIQPRWEQKQFSVEERSGKLLPVVSSGNLAGTLAINQDATVFVSKLASGQSATHATSPERHSYLFLISGEAKVNGRPLAAGDQARLTDETKLEITADGDAELILLDVP